MKTLYFECNMGAAGDMLMAALLELHHNPEEFLSRLNNTGISDVVVAAEPSVKCGIKGTHIKVTVHGQEEDAETNHHHHHHGHSHSDLHSIEHIINDLNISETVRENALAVYKLIAEAESHVHGVPVNQIHFHEVGEKDAIADIVGVCMLVEELAPDTILASPINTGCGQVRCAHGILPVPAPATAFILQNVPIYHDQIEGELCTPTGAAILKHFVKDFCKMPVTVVNKIGYGMGKKDFEKANCVRVFAGSTSHNQEEVTELVCNLDDITPESLAFAQQLLFEEGALDVYTTSIGMKKGRIGVSLTCMCSSDQKETMLSLIFKHTTTLGVREYTSRRYTMKKEQTEVQTKLGAVRVKRSQGFGVEKSKPEYEDVAKIARERGISIQDVLKEID